MLGAGGGGTRGRLPRCFTVAVEGLFQHLGPHRCLMHKLTGDKCPSLLVVGLAGDSSIASREGGVGSHGDRVGESAVTTKLPPGSSLPCPLKRVKKGVRSSVPWAPSQRAHCQCLASSWAGLGWTEEGIIPNLGKNLNFLVTLGIKILGRF